MGFHIKIVWSENERKRCRKVSELHGHETEHNRKSKREREIETDFMCANNYPFNIQTHFENLYTENSTTMRLNDLRMNNNTHTFTLSLRRVYKSKEIERGGIIWPEHQMV